MPFQSEQQRKFMWARHPEIARRWTNKYGSTPVNSSPSDSFQSPSGKMNRRKPMPAQSQGLAHSANTRTDFQPPGQSNTFREALKRKLKEKTK